MVQKIDFIINELEKNAIYLFMNQKNSFDENIKDLVMNIMDVIPLIIMSYSDEKMLDMREDAKYWSSQMTKILELCKDGKDVFAMGDALYFEMRENLIIYRNITIERSINL